MVDRFKTAVRTSPCAKLVYDRDETTGLAGSIQSRLTHMQAGGRSSSFKNQEVRFKVGELPPDRPLRLGRGFADEIIQHGKGVCSLRSKRPRFPTTPVHSETTELPAVIVKLRKPREPPQNPFHRTVAGDVNGHLGRGAARTYSCSFKSKSAQHPIHGFDLRQTIFANDNSSPVTWMGAGEIGPGEFDVGPALDYLAKHTGAAESAFKVKGHAGLPDNLQDDWRVSPFQHEDWTAKRTMWSNEYNRNLGSPFKNRAKRFHDSVPSGGAAPYTIPADNITNTNAKVICSPFKSQSPQIELLSKPPAPSAEALDYQPKALAQWENINKNKPMMDTSGKPSQSFQNRVKRFGPVQRKAPPQLVDILSTPRDVNGWAKSGKKLPKRLQQEIPFGAGGRPRFNSKVYESPCARLCYGQTRIVAGMIDPLK